MPAFVRRPASNCYLKHSTQSVSERSHPLFALYPASPFHMATENSEPHRDLSEARMHAVAGIRAYSDAPLYKNFAEHW